MAVGIGIFWVGYTLTWWGWRRLGGSVDLLDLVVPGRNPAGVTPTSTTTSAPVAGGTGARAGLGP
jgi:hypothetical protein